MLTAIFIGLSVILFFLILTWDVNSDYDKWKQGIRVNHTKEALLRIALLTPSTILLAVPKLLNSPKTIDHYALYIGLAACLLFAIWWELFDGWYNKKRGFKWRFNGTVDDDDSTLDRFLYSIGDTAEGVLKIGLIALFLFLYIKL
jgi:hypothetical protein